MDVMTLVEGEAMQHVYALFKRVHDEHGRGLTMKEFVSAFLAHIAEDARSRIAPQVLVKTLIDLYKQIDVNGDHQLVWPELTSYCIEAAMAAVSTRVMRPGFEMVHDRHFEDPHAFGAHCSRMQEMVYHPVPNLIVVVEAGSRMVHFCTPSMRLLSTLDTSTAFRAPVRQLSVATPMHHVLVLRHRLVAVLFNTLQVSLWLVNLRTFQYQGTIPRPETHTPCCLHYDAAGDALLVGCANGDIIVYDPITRSQRRMLRMHSDIILGITSTRREQFVSSSLDMTLTVWDALRMKPLRSLAGHNSPISRMLAVDAMDTMMCITSRGDVLAYDLGVGELSFRLPRHAHPVIDMMLMPTSPPRLVTVDSICTCRVWEVAAATFGVAPCSIFVQTDALRGFCPSAVVLTVPTRLRVAATEQWILDPSRSDAEREVRNAGAMGDLFLAVPRIMRIKTATSDAVDHPNCVFFAQSTLQIITLTARDIRLWDVDTGALLQHFVDCTPSDAFCGVLDDRHRKLIIGCVDGAVHAINLANGAIMKSGRASGACISNITYLVDDRCILCASDDGTLAVYDDEPHEELVDLRVVQAAHAASISAMAYSACMAVVITGDKRGIVRAWDFRDLKLIADMSVSNEADGGVVTIAFLSTYPAFIVSTQCGKLRLYSSRGHTCPFALLSTWSSTFATPTLQLRAPPNSIPSESERRWSLVHDGVVKKGTSPAPRPQLAALLDLMLVPGQRGGTQAAWKHFVVVTADESAGSSSSTLNRRVSLRINRLPAPIMHAECVLDTDINFYMLFGDEKGRLRVMDISRWLQRADLARIPPTKHVAAQPAYSARRRCHRAHAGPVITDDRFFYSDDDGTAAAASVADVEDEIGQAMRMPLSGAFGIGIQEAMIRRSTTTARVMRDAVKSLQARTHTHDTLASSHVALLSRVARTSPTTHAPTSFYATDDELIAVAEWATHNSALHDVHTFRPRDAAWCARHDAYGGDEGVPSPPLFALTCGADGRVFVWHVARQACAGEVGMTAHDADMVSAKLLTPMPWTMPPQHAPQEEVLLQRAHELHRTLVKPVAPAPTAQRLEQNSLFLTALSEEDSAEPVQTQSQAAGKSLPPLDLSRLASSRASAVEAALSSIRKAPEQHEAMLSAEDALVGDERQLLRQLSDATDPLLTSNAVAHATAAPKLQAARKYRRNPTLGAMFRQLLSDADTAPLQLSLDHEVVNALLSTSMPAAAVADRLGPSAAAVLGMSGYATGHLAAETAIETVREKLLSSARAPLRNTIGEDDLHGRIHEPVGLTTLQPLTSAKAMALAAATGGVRAPGMSDQVRTIRDSYTKLQTQRSARERGSVYTTSRLSHGSSNESSSSTATAGWSAGRTTLKILTDKAPEDTVLDLLHPRLTTRAPPRVASRDTPSSRPQLQSSCRSARAQRINRIMHAAMSPSSADATALIEEARSASSGHEMEGMLASRDGFMQTARPEPDDAPPMLSIAQNSYALSVAESAEFDAATPEPEADHGSLLPALIGGYSSIEVLKVRELYSTCPVDSRGEASRAAVQSNSAWMRMFPLSRVIDILSRLSDITTLRVSLRDVFKATFPRATALDVEKMVHFTSPRVLDELARQATRTAVESISRQQRKDLEAVFDALDADGNGEITLTEIREAMKHNSSKSDASWGLKDVATIMHEFDSNDNAAMDLEEFIKLMVDGVQPTRRLNAAEPEQGVR